MRLAVLVFVLCAVACVVAHAAILVSVYRRRSAVADANVPRPRAAMEILWALIPVLALAVLLTATWARVRDHSTQPELIMKVSR